MEDHNKNTELVYDLTKLSRSEKIDLLERLNELDRRLKYNKLSQWFPSDGPYRRSLYPKSLAFFAAGRDFKERVIVGGNRSGKTTNGNYEVAIHATGDYPDWWEGFTLLSGEDLTIWSCAATTQRLVANNQYQLLGTAFDIGSGMIPKDSIIPGSIKAKHGTANAVESFSCKRKDGSIATVHFLSYEQGRKAFQGTTVHFIHLDEEPKDPEIYSECVTRLMTTGGKIITTFTPQDGYTDIVMRFFPNGELPRFNVVPSTRDEPHISRWIVDLDWDDVPHLTQKEKDILWSSYLPHEREMRKSGKPGGGTGKIITIPQQDYTIPPMTDIPYHYQRCYGMDFALFGGTTAVVWGAYDERNDTWYIYDCYSATAQLPPVHAMAIRKRGEWIPGVIDPSAVRRKDDGIQWLQHYSDLGLNLSLANNSIEPGMAEMIQRLLDGRLRICWNCTTLIEAMAMYRLDKDGKIAKNQKDDTIDALRYLIMSGKRVAISLQEIDEDNNRNERLNSMMAYDSRSDTTGY